MGFACAMPERNRRRTMISEAIESLRTCARISSPGAQSAIAACGQKDNERGVAGSSESGREDRGVERRAHERDQRVVRGAFAMLVFELNVDIVQTLRRRPHAQEMHTCRHSRNRGSRPYRAEDPNIIHTTHIPPR